MNLKSLLGVIVCDIKGVLFAPKRYFQGLAKTGGYREPIFKTLIYGIFWALYFTVLTAGQSIFALISYFIVLPLFCLASLFAGSAVLFIISAICGGNKSFEASTRLASVLCALWAPFAIIALLPAISQKFYLSTLLLFYIYSLVVLFLGMTNTLNTKKIVTGAIIAFLAIIKVMIIVSLYILATRATKVISLDENDNPQVEYEFDDGYTPPKGY